MKPDDRIIRSIIKDLGKKLGTDATVGVMGDGGFAAEPHEFIPTSCTLLNASIGGGMAVGRITEILGDVQTGKSLLLLDTLANNQKNGGLSFYEDAEYGTSKDFAKKLCHIDDTTLGHLHVNTQEAAWGALFGIIEVTREHDKDKVVAVGLDSLAALPSKEEKEALFDEQTSISKSSRVIRGALKKLCSEIATERVSFIFTNHEICKIGAMAFAEKTMSWGGGAPRYFASTRLQLDIIGSEKIDGDIVAMRVRAKIVKNRFDPPGRKIDYLINVRGPHLGIDDQASLVEFLAAKGALGSKKGWVEYEGVQTRKAKLIEQAWENKEVYEDLKKRGVALLQSGVSGVLEEGVVDGA